MNRTPEEVKPSSTGEKLLWVSMVHWVLACWKASTQYSLNVPCQYSSIPRRRPSSLDQYIRALGHRMYPMIRLIPQKICISSPVTARFSLPFWRAYKLGLCTTSWMRSAGNRRLKKSMGSFPSPFTLPSPRKGGNSPSRLLSRTFQIFLQAWVWSSAICSSLVSCWPFSGSCLSSSSLSSSRLSVSSFSSAPMSLFFLFFSDSHSSSLLPLYSSLELDGNSWTIL